MNVIIADDDPTMLALIRIVVEQGGHSVVAAVRDGEAAWAAFEAEEVPLIILDWEMPKLDGLAVLEALNSDAATSHIPVVIMSNSSRDFEMKKASTLGAVAYWIKSNLSLQEICDRVEQLMQEKHENTE